MTLEQINQDIKETTRAKEQWIANANASAGRLALLLQLKEELEAKEDEENISQKENKD